MGDPHRGWSASAGLSTTVVGSKQYGGLVHVQDRHRRSCASVWQVLVSGFPVMPADGGTDRPGVSHIVISESGGSSLGDMPEGMVVYWWNDRPVGHEFVGCQESQRGIGGIDSNVLSRIRAEEERASQATCSASVVICTRDRPDQLQRCLASVSQQTYPAREIVVVDNAPRDERTKAVTEEAHAIYVREDRAGLGYARNAGARRATSDIVAYTDDDVIVHQRWLERLVAAFDRPEIGSVMGLVLPAELATDAQRHFERYLSFGRGYVRRDFDAASFAAHTDGVFPAWTVGAGASMAFRRDVLDRVGFFDERLGAGQAGCSEDSEFWYRLLAKGYSCRYEPRSVAFHFHRRTMEALSSQIFYYMRGHAAALLVQHERTGITANLTQAFWRMPCRYVRRLLRRVGRRTTPRDRFLKEEISGYLSGLLVYYRNRRRGEVPEVCR